MIESTKLFQVYQNLLDRLVPFCLYRWISFFSFLALFSFRIIHFQGWYIIAYGLGIYLLNIFLFFLSPKFLPSPSHPLFDEEDGARCAASLPTESGNEFKPFVRRLPEYQFWLSSMRATFIALICTCFNAFNVPVFWPILVLYFCILFAATMRRQIKHMIKFKYLPFTTGKKVYQSPGY